MVDPMMGNLLGDLIARLKLQLHLTSVVVTHDMRLAKKLADRIVFPSRRPRDFLRSLQGDGEIDRADHS